MQHADMHRDTGGCIR